MKDSSPSPARSGLESDSSPSPRTRVPISASYCIKGRIYSACVQSVLIYGTETWAMKADDLRSLERTESMMVRWTCGVSLKDRRRSEDLFNLLGIKCVADVVKRGKLRWFGHLERKSVDDWVSACRRLVVDGTRGQGQE